MTDEKKAEQVAALVRELEGYERSGNTDRAEQVRVELARIQGNATTPHARATRLSKPRATRKPRSNG